jgi:hypothetical protein
MKLMVILFKSFNLSIINLKDKMTCLDIYLTYFYEGDVRNKCTFSVPPSMINDQ